MKQNIMAPLWLMYPHIPYGSIGWRMGYGESYSNAFYGWFYQLSNEEKAEFNRKFPPPVCWGMSEAQLLRHKDFWTYRWPSAQTPVSSSRELQDEQEAGIHREAIYFLGHHPDTNRSVTKSCLSQWYLADFQVGHIIYCCMEQYMMSKKALLFGDEETNRAIMESTEQSHIKQLGRKVRGFDEARWNQFKRSIVLTGNYYKFTQIGSLRHYLLHTGDALLAEASPYDSIWGIGMSANEATACSVQQWRGENLLGFSLMAVRAEIERLWRHSGEIDFDGLHNQFD